MPFLTTIPDYQEVETYSGFKYLFEDIYSGKLNRKIISIALLSGALFLALLIPADLGSHRGPGFAEEDLPFSPLLMAGIIIGILGVLLLLTGKLEILAKTSR